MQNNSVINLMFFKILFVGIIALSSSCSVNKKMYNKKIAQIADSTGFVFHPTSTMEPVKKPENIVDTDFGFELWYKSSDVDGDIAKLTQDLKNQSKELSTNIELPLFWSTSWGNNWDPLGRWGRENMTEWHIALPNTEVDSHRNGADVSEKGQVWKVSITPYDGYIRTYFQLDCIKSGDRYYQYDLGDHDIYIHK